MDNGNELVYFFQQRHRREGTDAMATASPVEFRHYLRLATLEDIAAGMQPLRQQTANGLQLFAPPVLQFRYKVKGEGGVEWSPWSDINYAREGDELAH